MKLRDSNICGMAILATPHFFIRIFNSISQNTDYKSKESTSNANKIGGD